jgi:hypothetical protein
MKSIPRFSLAVIIFSLVSIFSYLIKASANPGENISTTDPSNILTQETTPAMADYIRDLESRLLDAEALIKAYESQISSLTGVPEQNVRKILIRGHGGKDAASRTTRRPRGELTERLRIPENVNAQQNLAQMDTTPSRLEQTEKSRDCYKDTIYESIKIPKKVKTRGAGDQIKWINNMDVYDLVNHLEEQAGRCW